jgi:L-lactate dehydrogenase complex protein LldF
MTGGNFAIAETGTFVVCTNEGNADIGAAVPPLHIASIGIEKLVPRVEDMRISSLAFAKRRGPSADSILFALHGPEKGRRASHRVGRQRANP